MATYDWSMCDKGTGQIDYIMSVNNNSDFSEAGFYGEHQTFQIETGVDHIKAVEESYYDYDDNMFKTRSKQPAMHYVWTKDKKWELDDTALMVDFRRHRTNKLVFSDWTQIADAPLTDEQKEEWKTYRQTLRDLTKNLPDGFDTLDGYVWPSEPS